MTLAPSAVQIFAFQIGQRPPPRSSGFGLRFWLHLRNSRLCKRNYVAPIVIPVMCTIWIVALARRKVPRLPHLIKDLAHLLVSRWTPRIDYHGREVNVGIGLMMLTIPWIVLERLQQAPADVE